MRKKFKMAVIEKFEKQYNASQSLNIRYDVLSKLINGWRQPTDRERLALVAAFGEKRVREFFADKAA
jgi:hypothetical protein